MATSACPLRPPQAGCVTLDTSIAGLPLLRLLATGSRAKVWLVPGDRVLKVVPCGPHVVAEIAALERARGEHVVELLDVSVGEEEAALIFPRLPRGSLAQLLVARSALDAGEAVTVLAPIASCLARIHSAGVAHGALSGESVLFRSDGAPMLTGFGPAVLFEAGLPEIALEGVDAVVADRRALAGIAISVLTRVVGMRAPAARELAERLGSGDLQELESRLAHELFELAASRPVRFEPDDEEQTRPVRAIGVGDVPGPPVIEPSMLARVLETGAGSMVRSWVRERWNAWPTARRRLALGGAAGLLAIVVLATVIPSGQPDEATEVIDAPSPTAIVVAETPLPSEVTGDDPLEALPALLMRRMDCFRDLSELCLEDVDEPGSSAYDDDAAAIQAITSDGVQPTLLDAGGATLVERLGDSAIVGLAPGTEPASLLLLKGEAGWRVRDYIAAPS